MAATPSKPSPSNTPVKGDDEAAVTASAKTTTTTTTEPPAPTGEEAAAAPTKMAPVVKPAPAAAAVALSEAAAAAKEPTYESSEASGYYTTAKAFLNSGDFEQALTTIEEGIQQTRQALLVSVVGGYNNDDSANNAVDIDIVALHPSMGPFHYLYGTTLLYSIEEANDGTQAMTTTEEGAANAAAASAGGGEAPPLEANAVAEDNADDMQIAFENLDTSRIILEDYLQKKKSLSSSSDDDKSADKSAAEIEKLQLDLAQIYLREGDLHKLNGRYDAAIRDYGQCLKFRQAATSLLGPYDRKIADVHYNLALTYSLAVAEAAPQQQQDQQDGKPAAATAGLKSTGDEDEDGPAPMSAEKMAEYKRKSFHHYFCCGKSFCGQLANLCGKDPQVLFEQAEKDIPAFKSTGDDDKDKKDDSEDDYDHPETVSRKLRSLTQLVVSDLQPPPEHQELFQSLLDVIIEIQETIDESENAVQAVQEMAGLKAEITAATAAAASESAGGEDAGGFGSAAAAASTATANDLGVASSSNGFGGSASAASATAAAAAAQPVMMVRKKKKRSEEESLPPSKQPKSE